jgi:hypothetical protein
MPVEVPVITIVPVEFVSFVLITRLLGWALA